MTMRSIVVRWLRLEFTLICSILAQLRRPLTVILLCLIQIERDVGQLGLKFGGVAVLSTAFGDNSARFDVEIGKSKNH